MFKTLIFAVATMASSTFAATTTTTTAVPTVTANSCTNGACGSLTDSQLCYSFSASPAETGPVLDIFLTVDATELCGEGNLGYTIVAVQGTLGGPITYDRNSDYQYASQCFYPRSSAMFDYGGVSFTVNDVIQNFYYDGTYALVNPDPSSDDFTYIDTSGSCAYTSTTTLGTSSSPRSTTLSSSSTVSYTSTTTLGTSTSSRSTTLSSSSTVSRTSTTTTRLLTNSTSTTLSSSSAAISTECFTMTTVNQVKGQSTTLDIQVAIDFTRICSSGTQTGYVITNLRGLINSTNTVYSSSATAGSQTQCIFLDNPDMSLPGLDPANKEVFSLAYVKDSPTTIAYYLCNHTNTQECFLNVPGSRDADFQAIQLAAAACTPIVNSTVTLTTSTTYIANATNSNGINTRSSTVSATVSMSRSASTTSYASPSASEETCGSLTYNQQCWRFRATNVRDVARLPIDYFITINSGNFLLGDRQANPCGTGGYPIVAISGEFDRNVTFPPTSTFENPDNCFYAEAASKFDNDGLGWDSSKSVTFVIMAGAARGNATLGTYYVSGTNGFGEWYNFESAVFIAAGPVNTLAPTTTGDLTTSTVYTTFTSTLPCPSTCKHDPTVVITAVLYTTVCKAGVPQPTNIPLVTSTVWTTFTTTVCPGKDICQTKTLSDILSTTVYPATPERTAGTEKDELVVTTITTSACPSTATYCPPGSTKTYVTTVPAHSTQRSVVPSPPAVAVPGSGSKVVIGGLGSAALALMGAFML